MESLAYLFKEEIAYQSQEWVNKQPVLLGDYNFTVRTAQAGVFYARQYNGKVIRVRNTAKVPPTFDLHVIVGRSRSLDDGIWQIIQVRETYLTPAASGEIDYHASQHEINGGDRIHVSRKQVMALNALVSDRENFIVTVFGATCITANGLIEVPTQNIDLFSYIITSGAKIVTVEMDNDGVMTVQNGTVFGAREIGTVDDIPATPDDRYLIAIISIYEGQLELIDDDITQPFPLVQNVLLYGSAAGGDLTGTYPNPTVAKLRGLLIDPAIAPNDGDTLVWNSVSEQWESAALSTGAFEPVTEETEKELVTWYVDGALAEVTDASFSFLATRNITLSLAYIYCKDNGSSGQTIIDINLNGTTIFTDQANRPELDSSTVYAASGIPDVIDLEPGDLLTIDIDDIATGASGLTLVLTEKFFEILFDEDGEIIVEEP